MMFYKNKSKKNKNSKDVHINKKDENLKSLEDVILDKISLNEEESEENNKLKTIYEDYSRNEINTESLFQNLKETPVYSKSVEDEISELFHNVRELLKHGDKGLIKHALEQIEEGKENISKFLENQKQDLDKNTLDIVNLIMNEYIYYMDYLNKALEIL